MADSYRTLIVSYDSYHTPLAELVQHLSGAITALLPVFASRGDVRIAVGSHAALYHESAATYRMGQDFGLS